jgi:hypothetical protein
MRSGFPQISSPTKTSSYNNRYSQKSHYENSRNQWEVAVSQTCSRSSRATLKVTVSYFVSTWQPLPTQGQLGKPSVWSLPQEGGWHVHPAFLLSREVVWGTDLEHRWRTSLLGCLGIRRQKKAKWFVLAQENWQCCRWRLEPWMRYGSPLGEREE